MTRGLTKETVMRFGVLVCVALSGALTGSCGGGEAPEGGGGRGRRGGRDLVFPVDAMPVEAKKVDYVVTAPGTIEAFEQVQVTARVAGAVDRVAFTEGQLVKEGDVLVVIDSERFRLAANSARAGVGKAVAGVKGASSMVARREAVSQKNPGLIPGEELDTVRTQKLSASADQQVAGAALKTAEVNLRDSAVRAPIAGVIQTRTVTTGQYVQPGALLATLLRSEPLLLRFRVEPLEAPRLKTGMVATFTLRETLRSFQAKITLVAAAADPSTHLVAVTAEVLPEKHRYWLRPGSFCDVRVVAKAGRSAPVIPRLAVRPTDHGTVAYVVEKGVAKERVVALGLSTKDGWVEIRSGLSAGDLLVIRGAEPLSSGAKVKVTQVKGPGLDAEGKSAGKSGRKGGRGDGGAGDVDAAAPGAADDAGTTGDAGAAAADAGEPPGQRLMTDAGSAAVGPSAHERAAAAQAADGGAARPAGTRGHKGDADDPRRDKRGGRGGRSGQAIDGGKTP